MLKHALTSVLAALALTFGAISPNFAQDHGAAMLPSPKQSGYAPVNGVEIYYAVHGEGDPLVLLHGGLTTMEIFNPILAELAEHRTVIGVDLQAHGRTLPLDRPMAFETLATDIAELIGYLGYGKADILGYSFGGSVGLRTAIDHPEVVDRLVLVSTPYAFSGWHDYNAQGMRSIGAHLAEGMKGTPLYEAYEAVAPDVENWPRLLEQMGTMIGKDYDWSSEISGIQSPTMIVVGDHDSVRISHATQFFELLGGGKVDGGWDRSGVTSHRFAVLPNQTHYEIINAPFLAETALGFLDADR